MRTMTNVTAADLTAAQGGIGGDERILLVVDCPTSYDPETITAEDIVHDPAIRVVERVHLGVAP